jgi:hypothetical protein
MADIQGQLEQAKSELERATQNLAIWESFEAVTVTNEKGKEMNVRSQMIAHCKWNMHKYREIIAALEKRANSSN